jgi:hypothetical protein
MVEFIIFSETKNFSIKTLIYESDEFSAIPRRLVRRLSRFRDRCRLENRLAVGKPNIKAVFRPRLPDSGPI